LSLPGAQDELIARVLAVNPNTVVVNNSGAPISMPWVNQAPAILQCWFPGQEFGRALMDLLFGEVSPSGRLPLTFPKQIEDVPAFAHYPGSDGQVRYEEGLNVGYRGFHAAQTEPLFAFGHGLAYTQFDYSDLHAEFNAPEALVSVSLWVTNTGMVAGQEVVQVYVCFPDSQVTRPALSLAGFTKVTIAPGIATRVTLSLPLARFKFWDTDAKAFQLESGACTIQVGASARDLKLTTSLLLD
jgi:beta-glucosidase